ncbi:MAG: anaerobic ribonucleoside-triphosphate reductase [Oscillospiraceae bacterium]|nr:anaerobic ribonucleoside-triphosphate reductase [Oscillospiraceae bacterium]
MIPVRVTGGKISAQEQEAYLNHAKEKYPDKQITGIDIAVDGDYVDLHYHFQPVPFERIRRITGYLVGTMDRWNNAKKAEEADRVKHDLNGKMEHLS